MDKNEILEKSRKENRDQDEREKTVRIQGESFSLILVFAVGLALTSYKLWRGLPVGDILAMFWACSLGSCGRKVRRELQFSVLSWWSGIW